LRFVKLTKHTVIEDKRLGFDGKATQLFGQWIKWLLNNYHNWYLWFWGFD